MDIGRPGRDETTGYYHGYIDQVPEGDVRTILARQRDETLSFLEAIPESRASHRYAPEKWSVAGVLCHINDCERLYAFRAFWFARGLPAPLPSFEPELVLNAARPEDRSLESHAREFASVRAATLDLFDNLPDEAWLRRGIASEMPFSVRALAYIAAGHVIHHSRVLKERYL